MTIRTLLVLGAISLAPVLPGPAQTLVNVNWGVGAQNITGDADVSTSGTLVQATNLGVFTAGIFGNWPTPNYGETTVNGVKFDAVSIPTGVGSVPVGNFTLSESPGLLSAWGNGEPYQTLLPQLSLEYRWLLQSSATTMNQPGEGGGGGENTMTLSMPTLVVGKTYAFQWWSNTQGASFTSVTGGLTLSANAYYDTFPESGVNGLGHFAIGTFTASDTTMYIEFNGVTNIWKPSNSFPLVSAFQLRDISAVPEPTTYALVMGALVLATALHRRKGMARSNAGS